ncbi:hypothetical protein CPB84DRAFT_1854178 [Gymnopilus junonius]|uniref:3-carboxymuconate cyclase n=1 Tax=Gymnopilus junonius TaxID=109634 RepID=A0A9P5TGE3_GYMJU|nr:hypothetical protein CPB84DRAFT_1854178 [Gymnopilus junonius]
MHISTKSVLIAALALATTVSTSLAPRNSIAGAVYFLTNDPSGNKVVSVSISADGLVGPTVHASSTEGRGLRGMTDPPNSADALFSQGSVAVNSNARLLAAVNAGSNTVSLFSINPDDPTRLTLLGRPVPSGGDFPQSVAINSRGTDVCVLNGGKVNGVNCYATHPIFGLLPRANSIRLLNRNQTNPPSGPLGSLSSIIFSPDDSRLLAAVKGTPTAPGFIATWAVGFDGLLSSQYGKSTPAPGGGVPFSLTPIPGTNAYIATDAALGFDIFNFASSNNRNSTLEAASSTVTAIPGQGALCWSTYSSKSGNFYLIDTMTDIVSEVQVDGNLNGSLVKQYQLAAGSAILDAEVATVNHNDFLYVLSAIAASIDVLSVSTPGKAKSVQTFPFTSAAKQAGATFTNINLQGLATYIKN